MCHVVWKASVPRHRVGNPGTSAEKGTPHGESLAGALALHGRHEAVIRRSALSRTDSPAAGRGLCVLAPGCPFRLTSSTAAWRTCPDPPRRECQPSRTVVKPNALRDQAAPDLPPPCLDAERTTFTLPDAIAQPCGTTPAPVGPCRHRTGPGPGTSGLLPFLPQIRCPGAVRRHLSLAPGIPGPTGFVALQWTLRFPGGPAAAIVRRAPKSITELQYSAGRVVEFMATTTWTCSWPVRRDGCKTMLSAQAIWTTRWRRKEGVAARRGLLRAEVQLSEAARGPDRGEANSVAA